jgi:EthD domain-containing protein
MVKLTFCLRRQAHLTREECSRYWREIHAPLVRERAEILGVRRYVQRSGTSWPRTDARSRVWRGPRSADEREREQTPSVRKA